VGRGGRRWKAFASDPGCRYDDVVTIDAADIAPTVTWGINPGQGISVTENDPGAGEADAADEKASIEEALAYMKLQGGAPIKGTKIDVAFLGSCTNGRLSDFQEVARNLKGRRVAPGVKAIAVPGSQIVALQCAELGHRQGPRRGRLRVARGRLLDVPRDEPRQARRRPALRELLQPQFQGPPGQPTGRTLLMSPSWSRPPPSPAPSRTPARSSRQPLNSLSRIGCKLGITR
jgi:3-isopropylmalate/(R)-2-methylmalate dehydratase large subunit